VEVAASSALLATLLSGMMLAKARFDRQTQVAQQRLDAAAAAENLLAQWWVLGDAWPVNRQGAVPERRDWNWRTEEQASPPVLAAARLREARLEIVNETGEVLCAVELLLPPVPENAFVAKATPDSKW